MKLISCISALAFRGGGGAMKTTIPADGLFSPRNELSRHTQSLILVFTTFAICAVPTVHTPYFLDPVLRSRHAREWREQCGGGATRQRCHLLRDGWSQPAGSAPYRSCFA
jgi:hypothetical protein